MTPVSEVVWASNPEAVALLESSPRVDADGTGLLDGPGWTRGFRCLYDRGVDVHSRDQKEHPHVWRPFETQIPSNCRELLSRWQPIEEQLQRYLLVGAGLP